MPPLAGPSRPPARVSTFLSDEDDDDDAAPRVKRSRLPSHAHENGAAKPMSARAAGQPNGAAAGPDARHGRAGSEAARRKRREAAAKLLVKRYELPFYQARWAVLDEIVKNDTVVIVGETGCGKSTQLPQLLRTHSVSLSHFSSLPPVADADADRRRRGPRVAITQPRRLPTIALAARVAAEMGAVLGGEVGYSVRFEDATSRDTRVRFLTEGVMMRELANGSDDDGLNLLLRYDVIVIDEAHERTLNTDFLLGCLKKIQATRKELVARQKEDALAAVDAEKVEAESEAKPNGMVNGSAGCKVKVTELKIVIMSATLDPAKFTKFFDNCPALHVPGRIFSVDTAHTAEPVDDFIEAAAECVLGLHTREPKEQGDVLVFMPGSDEIETLVSLLRRRTTDRLPSAGSLQVLPLYASLPPTAQAKIFAPLPPDTRRVVVATNIAETSLTIPGTAFVVDSGYKKEKEYIYRNSGAIEHLRKMQISQAAAWQRTGRAGREMAGKCYRLYTKKTFLAMPAFDTPEIQRVNLAACVLQLVAMRQDPFAFAYLDPPGRDAIAAAFRTLAGLGAISSPTDITALGTDMLKYPLDPEHGRILVEAVACGCVSEVVDVLAVVVSGNLWVEKGSEEGREAVANARQRFVHRDGDHLTAMNVLRAYVAIKEQGVDMLGAGASADADAGDVGEVDATPAVNGDVGGKGKKRARAAAQSQQGGVTAWCRANHVNSKTLAAALKVRAQLRELVGRHGHDAAASCGSNYDSVGKCLVQGLFMNTAVIQADGTYRQTAGSLQVKIHPSSVLMSRKVPAIVYDELAITSAIYARNVSAFEQGWLADVPWFAQAGRGAARAVERRAA
ncbi:Salivary acidic proline-rich phosphoprotein 1/2 [Cryptotrichosporon argae]